MMELINIHNNGTHYLQSLKKLARVKEEPNPMHHIDSKIRIDGRSNSPRSPSYSKRRFQTLNESSVKRMTSTQINLFGRSERTDASGYDLLDTDRSYQFHKNSYAILMAEER